VDRSVHAERADALLGPVFRRPESTLITGNRTGAMERERRVEPGTHLRDVAIPRSREVGPELQIARVLAGLPPDQPRCAERPSTRRRCVAAFRPHAPIGWRKASCTGRPPRCAARPLGERLKIGAEQARAPPCPPRSAGRAPVYRVVGRWKSGTHSSPPASGSGGRRTRPAADQPARRDTPGR